MANGTIKNKNITDAVGSMGPYNDIAIEKGYKKRKKYAKEFYKEELDLAKKVENQLLKARKQSETRMAQLKRKNAAAQDKIDKQLIKANSAGNEKEVKKLQALKVALNKELLKQEKKEKQELWEQERTARLNMEKELNEEAGKALKDKLNSGAIKWGDMAGKAQDAMFGALDTYMGVYSEHMTEITARLNGAGKGYDYRKLEEVIRKNTITNPYIKYTDTLDNLAALVELGIADNVAQRAFLQTISDKVVTTFDAHTSSMLQIIRIQQRDTTAARMGMEAELTELFNHYFSDTSYLSTAFDGVQEALIGVSSQLDHESGVEFEYIVQKWLGSLGSVGVSDSTLTNIAQAISHLGTGDVDALSSNASMQNLIVMSANRVGLDYGNMLTNGVSSKDVNALLGSMISYIQSIAASNNNVVKAQYAELFGLTMADMQAFRNIQKSVLDALLENGMTYSNTLTELDTQIGQISKRMHISEMMDNLLDNVLANLGTQISSNPALAGLYKAASFLESVTGGIELPFISAFGNGFDLNMSLEGLIKTGVAGIGMVGTIISALGNIGSSPMSLDRWNVQMDKGQGFTSYANVGQLTATKSSTGSISNSNNTGISQSLSDTQKQTGEDVNGTDEPEEEELVLLIREIKKYLVDAKLGTDIAIKTTVDNWPTHYTTPSGINLGPTE